LCRERDDFGGETVAIFEAVWHEVIDLCTEHA
jgi:hypothetical protein